MGKQDKHPRKLQKHQGGSRQKVETVCNVKKTVSESFGNKTAKCVPVRRINEIDGPLAKNVKKKIEDKTFLMVVFRIF